MLGRLRVWLDHRFGLGPIRRTVLDRRVPKGAWYQGDGAALVLLLMVLVITGVFMTPTYSPTPDTAYESVRVITEEQAAGWFVRALHFWSAGMMVVMVIVHLLRQILVGGYKLPREGTWLVGVALLTLVIAMGFTGYLLRWDERAIYGLRVALNMFWRVPVIGEELVVFVQGGADIGGRTLTRLYAVHVVFVPMLLLALVGYHLYLIVLRGITSRAERGVPIRTVEEHHEIYVRAEESEAEGEVFHPRTTAKSGTFAFVVFLIALGLAIGFGPRELMPEANLVAPAFPIEEWYFYWYSALIALLPRWLAPTFFVAFPLAVLGALVLLPFLDRSPFRGMRRRPVAVAAVVVVAAGLLFLTDLRRRSPWTGWPDPEPPPAPSADLPPDAEAGRLLFARYGCTSCHAIADAGREVGPDLTAIQHRMSAQELRDFILEPPDGVTMPAYRGRVSARDLDRLVRFVLITQMLEQDRRVEEPQ